VGGLAQRIGGDRGEGRLRCRRVVSTVCELLREALQGADAQQSVGLSFKLEPLVVPVGQELAGTTQRLENRRIAGVLLERATSRRGPLAIVDPDIAREREAPGIGHEQLRVGALQSPHGGAQARRSARIGSCRPQRASYVDPRQWTVGKRDERQNALSRAWKRYWTAVDAQLERPEQLELCSVAGSGR
jgi:hypothetical protein